MNKFLILAIVLILVITAVFYFNKKVDGEGGRQRNSTSVNLNNEDALLQKQPIDKLTKEVVVVTYFKKYSRLPDCYITKNEARNQGWDPAIGNLCRVLPGRAIGGDVFTNREGRLPKQIGRKWYEADINYNCGSRNADRLLYSNDKLVYVTYDHYKTFNKR